MAGLPGEQRMTLRQRRFVHEYLKDGNAVEAARRAGYKGSDERLKRSSYDVRWNKLVAAAIEEAQQRRAERVEVKADDVLIELLRLLKSDISQAFNEDGSMKPLHEMPDGVRRAIAGVEIVEYFEGQGKDRKQVGFIKKVKLWDKAKSIELALRHLGMLQDRVVHDLGPSWVEALERIEQRMRNVGAGRPVPVMEGPTIEVQALPAKAG